MFSRPYPRSARPNSAPAARRCRGAACRLLASATDGSPSTPAPCPTFTALGGKPPLGEWRRAFRFIASRAFSGQGSLGFFDRVDPHHGDRSPQWIYPALTGSGTLCHETVFCSAWNPSWQNGPAVGGLFRTISSRASDFRPLLTGPSCMLTRESWHEQPHPGCLPPQTPPRREAGLCG